MAVLIHDLYMYGAIHVYALHTVPGENFFNKIKRS